MVNKYRTKPCEIEAIQYNCDNYEEIYEWCDFAYMNYNDDHLYIDTLEGTMQANIGDYIIKGLCGEFYPCKPDVFEKKYEVVE